MRKKLFLFDIDGTIISPGNVGRKLLDKIFLDNFHRSPNLKYEDVAGSTDPIIVEKGLLKIGEKTPLSQSIEFILKLYQKSLETVFNKSNKPFVSISLVKSLKAWTLLLALDFPTPGNIGSI